LGDVGGGPAAGPDGIRPETSPAGGRSPGPLHSWSCRVPCRWRRGSIPGSTTGASGFPGRGRSGPLGLRMPWSTPCAWAG
jgi:hypothetical protein